MDVNFSFNNNKIISEQILNDEEIKMLKYIKDNKYIEIKPTKLDELELQKTMDICESLVKANLIENNFEAWHITYVIAKKGIEFIDNFRRSNKYILEKNKPKEKYYEVYLNADYNDADYIATVSKFSQDKFDKYLEVLISLNDICGKPHKLTDFDTDCWYLDIPASNGNRCHTLYEIKIRMYDTDGSVYNVTLL